MSLSPPAAAAVAVIVAAGQGLRMQSRTRKQYLPLKGISVVGRTLLAFDACDRVGEIALVVPAADVDFCRAEILPEISMTERVTLVIGGATRQESVLKGLRAMNRPGAIAVIHDGVRPLVQPEQIHLCIDAAAEAGACILALPVKDTLKRVGPDGKIEKTFNREGLWMAQTPQAFRFELILAAHEQALRDRQTATDDAQLVEMMGSPVAVLPGNPFNLKITTREDLTLAELILAAELV
jgi:2-C-methyl-D-erythritol 4-phosphate cytidylyltransferase